MEPGNLVTADLPVWAALTQVIPTVPADLWGAPRLA